MDILTYFRKCICFKKKDGLRSDLKFRTQLFYNIGNKKLMDELDCITLIKSMR